MISAEEPHPYHSKDCELCTGEDAEIQVSVSPRRFSLPHASEKKRKMQIKNGNPYPIYFKAGTSNMDALIPQPDSGRIPANSKVTVFIQFLDSVIPIKRHEEVVVLASARPFEHHHVQEDNVCPYCYKSVHHPKFRNKKKFIHTGEYFPDREDYCYSSDSKISRQGIVDHNSYHDCRGRPCDPKEWISQRKAGQFQRHFEVEPFKIKNATRRHIGEIPAFEEICLHAIVHHMWSKDCDCQNCVYFGTTGQKTETKTIESDRVKTAREVKMLDQTSSTTKLLESPYTVSKKEEQIMKEMFKDQKNRGGVINKAKEAHVMARIVKAENARETSSDTEISDMSNGNDKIKKRTKFVSEDEFKKKLEKSKMKKHQMRTQLGEESKTTNTTENIDLPKEHEKSPVRKSPTQSRPTKRERKWTIMAVDSKCSFILQITWVNFFLLLLLLLIVIVFTIYAYVTFNVMHKKRGHFRPCFFDLFWN